MKHCIFLFTMLLLITQTAYADIIKFYIKDDQPLLKKLNTYKLHEPQCDDLLARLVFIKNIEYYDLTGTLRNDGEIIVLDAVADSIIKIFEELKGRKFLFHGINPFLGVYVENNEIKIPDDYNYTGCYACRAMANNTKRSIHSYGLAIDVNPLHNPYIGIDLQTKKIINIVPVDGILYLNSMKNRPGKPAIGSKIDIAVVKIFKKYGFDVWGGYWDYPIDYQHFEPSRQMVETLYVLSADDAQKFFEKNVKYTQKNGKSMLEDSKIQNNDILTIYKQDKNKFWALINSI